MIYEQIDLVKAPQGEIQKARAFLGHNARTKMVGRHVGNFVNLSLVKCKFLSNYHRKMNKDKQRSNRSKCIREGKEYQSKQDNQHGVTTEDNNKPKIGLASSTTSKKRNSTTSVLFSPIFKISCLYFYVSYSESS